MKVVLTTRGADDEQVDLEEITMSAPPRAGEHFTITGPEYGGEVGGVFVGDFASLFVVRAVSYALDAVSGDVVANVWLDVAAEAVFMKRCTCVTSSITISEPDECRTCGKRVT